MKYVLDSNILISVLNCNDKFHDESTKLVEYLNSAEAEILAPVIQLWEIDAYARHTEKFKNHVSNSANKFKITP